MSLHQWNLHQWIKLGLWVGGLLVVVAVGMQCYFLLRNVRRRSET